MARHGRGFSAHEDAPKRKLDKSGFKKLLGIYQFVIPYRSAFVAGMICLVFSSTVLLAFPYLTGKLVDVSLGEQQWFLQNINQVSLALVLVLAVQGLFSFLRIYFFSKVS